MATDVTTADELRRRVHELRAVRAELLPDVDDLRVLSEITTVEAALTAAQRDLATLQAACQR